MTEAQTHDYYGVPLWLMKEYLEQLGAQDEGDDVLVAAGWRAQLRKADARRLGSLGHVCELDLMLEEYYEDRGWVNGVVPEKKLRELEIVA